MNDVKLPRCGICRGIGADTAGNKCVACAGTGTGLPTNRFTPASQIQLERQTMSQLSARIAELEQKLAAVEMERDAERELSIMQLAAISTASIQNTEKSKQDRIAQDNPYWSIAYGDTCVAVDREMRLRAENERLRGLWSPLAAQFEDARIRRGQAAADWFEKMPGDWPFEMKTTMEHMRKVRTALEGKGGVVK